MPTAYDQLDRPDILSAIFHPRPQLGPAPAGASISDHMIPVDDHTRVGARFHVGSKSGPSILFFHGNGEIAADYDDLGPLYNGMGINLLAADYRGYGLSEGRPSVGTMMSDCHLIFQYAVSWLEENACHGPLVVMGRSLGSASALELTERHQDRIDGLIIESGFAYALPLLRLLGVDTSPLALRENDGFGNLQKIAECHIPTLIIHAEFDHIIPYTDAKALFNASAAQDKQLLKIDHANHNDILIRGFDPYMQAIARLLKRLHPKQPET